MDSEYKNDSLCAFYYYHYLFLIIACSCFSVSNKVCTKPIFQFDKEKQCFVSSTKINNRRQLFGRLFNSTFEQFFTDHVPVWTTACSKLASDNQHAQFSDVYKNDYRLLFILVVDALSTVSHTGQWIQHELCFYRKLVLQMQQLILLLKSSFASSKTQNI